MFRKIKMVTKKCKYDKNVSKTKNKRYTNILNKILTHLVPIPKKMNHNYLSSKILVRYLLVKE